MSSYIRTFSGKKIDVFNATIEDIDPIDIAHALSLKVRWQGHCNTFYSVAHHSLRVASVVRLVAPDLYLPALLHDAAEAYLPDVPSPVKPQLSGFKELENKLEDVIFERFNIPILFEEDKKIIKHADHVLLRLESKELFSYDPEFDDDGWPGVNFDITPEEIAAAKFHLLDTTNTKYLFYNELISYENSTI